jgi:hypothetical protein
MYKRLVVLLLGLIVAPAIYAHDQTVHMHMTRDAFALLCKSFPGLATSEMTSFIGTNESWSGGSKDGSFAALKIVSGSFVEDEYDPVYGYGLTRAPTYNQDFPVGYILQAFASPRAAYTTITHFWDADNGEYAATPQSDWATILGIPV